MKKNSIEIKLNKYLPYIWQKIPFSTPYIVYTSTLLCISETVECKKIILKKKLKCRSIKNKEQDPM